MLNIYQQFDYSLVKICLTSTESLVKLTDKWMISWGQILLNIGQKCHFQTSFGL